MQTRQVKINYHGFHPSMESQAYVNDVLEEILVEGPMGATLEAAFTVTDGNVKGSIHLHSRAGKFFHLAEAEKPEDVAHVLLARMRRSLSKWKTRKTNRASLKRLHEMDDVMGGFANSHSHFFRNDVA